MIKIITLPFEHELEDFNDEPLQQFLAGKTIKKFQPEFFQVHEKVYWSVWIEYEPLVPEIEKRGTIRILTPLQQQLLNELREWRKERAEAEQVPVFVIATNRELESIAAKMPASISALGMIRGFGRKKIEKYGKQILTRVARFAKADPENQHPRNEPTEPEKNGE